MRFSNARSKKLLFVGALATATLTAGIGYYAQASDHAGTVAQVQKPGIDLTDLHIFPAADPTKVVLAMSVSPLIQAGAAVGSRTFDPDVLYQFKIDTTGDNVEDLVIQARASGTGVGQKVLISGPVKPSRTGVTNVFETPNGTGVFNTPFTTTNGMRVFAGLRGDPFFIDLEQLFAILPDRGTPIGVTPPPAGQENTPQTTTFRAKGVAKDFLANFNVLAIVVEVPRSLLGGGKIGVWETTSTAS